VSRRVERRVVRVGLTGDREQSVPVDPGVLGLVEGKDIDVVVLCARYVRIRSVAP
jgi:hypothetical protein